MTEPMINDHLVLISGESTTGKSASLRDLKNPEGVMYLNCEAGKRLPFRAKFMKGPDGQPGFVITDPYQVYEAFDHAETLPDCHTIVVDSATFLMDMMESVHVLTATDTQKAWGAFAQFWKKLMQDYVARSSKNVVFTAHTLTIYNEKDLAMDTKVPVKGSLKNNGIESYFSMVLSTKRMALKELENYQNALLTITPEEEILGFKYVFQTKLTKETVRERIRSPMGMWDTNETFIDNNMEFVLKRLREYYRDKEAVA